MEFLVVVFYLFIFSFIIVKVPFFRKASGLPLGWLLFFFGLKVLSGALLIFIYTYYYTETEFADIYKYFNDGRILFSAIHNHFGDYLRMLTGIDGSAAHLEKYYLQMGHWFRPWESAIYNDSRLVIRFNALVSLFSLGYIQVHSVFINFLSFSGLVALLGFFRKHGDSMKLPWLAAGIFLIPGVLFWGSGILKESLLIWAFGFWNYYLDRIISGTRQKWVYSAIPLALYTFVLILLKPYTFYLWLPCIACFYFCRNSSALKFIVVQTLIIAACVVVVMAVRLVYPQYDLLVMIATKQNDFIAQSLYYEASSLIHTRLLEPSFADFVRGFLTGLWHAFTRPHLFEANSLVILMAAFENLLIAAMILYGLITFRKIDLNLYPLKWSALWFTILFFGLVGMITVAHGGMVRYRIPALPFLWFFFVQMAHFPVLKLPWRVRVIIDKTLLMKNIL